MAKTEGQRRQREKRRGCGEGGGDDEGEGEREGGGGGDVKRRGSGRRVVAWRRQGGSRWGGWFEGGAWVVGA
ncbi:UNVERIFIED_CONTAM: hypothetical protein Sangu_2689600 [Sesamum angustifolium]|uniref:Uncharacterized protein n=1 Tax=Sesamum angustifolium TaxID=2727405 RepID=A0AAW2IYK9_9LAMI